MTSFNVDDVRTDLAIIRAVGRLNMVAAPELRDVVARLVQSGKSRLVVDLSGVEFMDSSGLGALIGALKTTRQAGGDLRIAAPGEQVLMVLQLSNVDRILKPYENADDTFQD
ncbi:MAG TPA: STAS domain-containing protein [Propionicimonas sp.]|uniref:STAS domain-containing protein n=1 Tax=Propionicimonas sp. TaxID=1955623 RepID=UPI002F42CFB5